MRGHGGGSAPEAPWGPGAEWLAPPTRLPWAESGCQAVLSRCRAAWALGRDAAQEGIKVDGLRVGCRPDPARSAVGAHQGAAVDGAPGVAVPGFPGPGLPSYWKPAHCPSACLWGPWPGVPGQCHTPAVVLGLRSPFPYVLRKSLISSHVLSAASCSEFGLRTCPPFSRRPSPPSWLSCHRRTPVPACSPPRHPPGAIK